MKTTGPRLWASVCCVALLPVATAFAQQQNGEIVETTPRAAQMERVVDFDIGPQSLSAAMIQFADQSGIQVVTAGEEVSRLKSAGVSGSHTIANALTQLLAGTSLKFVPVGASTIALTSETSTSAEAVDGGVLPPAVAASSEVLAGAAVGELADGATESVTSVRRGGIEEIIVTARRREESVQDVPISITAISAEDMKSFGIRNVADMEGIVPGLNMSGGGNGLKKDSNPFIRGVGQRETKVTLDPGVGTYIDGIYLARTGGALLDTVGMERVEVLRGPQGTLFGRNAVGGSISFTTIKPKPGLDGSLTANIGNFGRSDLVAVANIPLIGNELLSRITVSSKNSEGTFTNVVDNTKWGNDNRITGIGQVRWIASDDLVFDVLAERTRIRETPRPSKCAIARQTDRYTHIPDPARPWDPNGFLPEASWYNSRNLGVNPNYFYPLPVRTIDNARTGIALNMPTAMTNSAQTFEALCKASQALPTDQFASDFAESPDFDGNDVLGKGRYWIDTATAGLTAAWDIGDLGPLRKTQFKSISAWRKVEQIADEDLDAIPISQLLRVQDGFNESWQATQELRFSGAALNDRLFFSTGLYYFTEETPQDALIRTAGLGQTPLPQVSTSPASNGRYKTTALEATREVLETENEAYAWYGQIDFDLTTQLQLSAGLRYTHEDRWSAYSKGYAVGASIVTGALFVNPDTGAVSVPRDWNLTEVYTSQPGLAAIQDWAFYSAEFPCAPGAGAVCDVAGVPGYEGISATRGTAFGRKTASTQDDAWTPMVSLKYHADASLLDMLKLNDAMAYVTYSGGFGAGGVTSGAVDTSGSAGLIRIEDPLIFKPQYVNNYELGLKLQGLDRRIQANIAVFYMDYKDMQVTSTANRGGVPIPFIDNVGKSVIQGVESEFVFLPTLDWRVILNAAYTHADMKEWDARLVALNPLTGEPIDAYREVPRDDEPMPRVPRWQGYLLTDYTFRLANGGILTPSIAARYTSEIYHGFDRGSFLYGRDVVTAEEVTFLDARVSYISPDQKMELAFWGKNLTDKQDYLVGAIPLVDTTGTVGQIFADPRTFGLTMTYNFGAQ